MSLKNYVSHAIFIHIIQNISLRIFCSFLLIILFTSSLSAQRDTTYIKVFTKKFSFKTGLQLKIAGLSEQLDDDNKVDYLPNNPINIGAAISWKRSYFTIGYSPIKIFPNKSKMRTKSFDFQYSYHGDKIIYDLFLQKYKGFSAKDEGIERPDMTLLRLGIFGQYFFNNKKFSYQSAFGFSERQLRSAGSWQVGFGLYYNEVKAPNLLLFENRLEDMKHLQFGPGVGYVYTYVFKDRFFLTGGLTAAGNLTVDLHGKDKLKVSPSLVPRVSYGYHADDWSVAASYVSNVSFLVYKEQESVTLHSGRVEISFVKRFDFQSKVVDKVSKLLTK